MLFTPLGQSEALLTVECELYIPSGRVRLYDFVIVFPPLAQYIHAASVQENPVKRLIRAFHRDNSC